MYPSTKSTLYKQDQQMTYLMVFMLYLYVVVFSDFLYETYVVGTHLNCIDKSMQFK